MNLITWTYFNMTESNNVLENRDCQTRVKTKNSYINCLLNTYFSLKETTKVREN